MNTRSHKGEMLITVLCPTCLESQGIDPTRNYFVCYACGTEFEIKTSGTGSISTFVVSTQSRKPSSSNPAGKFDIGTVYVATNNNMPNLVKIGHTTRNVAARMSELSAATGVPGKFSVVKTWEVNNSALAEQKIFAELREHRYSKEFFKLEPVQAVQLISFLFRKNFELGKLLNDAKQARDREDLIAKTKIYQETLKDDLIRRWNDEYSEQARQAFHITVSELGDKKWMSISMQRTKFLADQNEFQSKKESQWKQISLLSLIPLALLVAVFPPILGLAILLWPITLFIYYHFEDKHASRGARELTAESWYEDFRKYATHFEKVFRERQYNFFKNAGIEAPPSLSVPRLEDFLNQSGNHM